MSTWFARFSVRPSAGTEGFGSPTWHDICAVDHWDECAPADFIWVFPRLLPGTGELPDRLLQHLRECVAVRAWRVRQREGRGASGDRTAVGAGHTIRRANDAWFPAPSLRRRLTGQPASDLQRERDRFAFVDGIYADIVAGRPPVHDETRAARFAFLTGIHPAYLWPSELVSHERGLVAGWLGRFERRQTANIPEDVAAVLNDVLASAGDGSIVLRDRHLATLVDDGIDLPRVHGLIHRRHPVTASGGWDVDGGRTGLLSVARR